MYGEQTSMIRRFVIIGLISATLFGCQRDGEPIVKEFNKEGVTLRVTVDTVYSDSAMRKRAWQYEEGLRGQTLYSAGDNVCDIIVREPTSLDDDATRTLGHELMHCLYGDYHK